MQIPNVFDNERRYIFNNWTTEDFTGTWAGAAEIIKAGETKEYPMYKAFHYTKHLVDREMIKEGKAGSMSSDEERKPLEDKTMAEIADGVDSPALASIKEKIRKEVEESVNEKKPEKSDKKEKKEFDALTK